VGWGGFQTFPSDLKLISNLPWCIFHLTNIDQMYEGIVSYRPNL